MLNHRVIEWRLFFRYCPLRVEHIITQGLPIPDSEIIHSNLLLAFGSANAELDFGARTELGFGAGTELGFGARTKLGLLARVELMILYPWYTKVSLVLTVDFCKFLADC